MSDQVDVLERFHAFVGRQLTKTDRVTPEEALALFRAEEAAVIADVEEGLADERAGRVVRVRDLARRSVPTS